MALPKNYEYMTAKDIYYSKPVNNETSIYYNLFAKIIFSTNKNNIFKIVLEDFTLECQINVVLTKDIYQKFEKYFKPWFLFRFHRLRFTSTSAPYQNEPKKLYFNLLNDKVGYKWITVFRLIDTLETGNRFVFHFADNPTIENSDWQIVTEIQQQFCEKIRNVSIENLIDSLNEPNFRTKRQNDFINESFIAQIIGIKQIAHSKMIVKVWDGTTPGFPAKLPANQAHETNEEIIIVNDRELEAAAKGKFIYVFIQSDTIVSQFAGKKPSDLIFFNNAKIYKTKTYPPFVRIDLCSANHNTADRQDVCFFNANTNLGRLLVSRINPAFNEINEQVNNELNNQINNLHSHQFHNNLNESISNESMLSTGNSFENNPARNLIQLINDFSFIKHQSANYQVQGIILDLFPIEYKFSDFIKYKCAKCKMVDESIENLFGVDLVGLKAAAQLYWCKYRKNNEMQCPSCSQEACFFHFQIPFLLQDQTNLDNNHRMFAFLDSDYAERYFKMNPLQVVADENEEQFIFMRKIEYLKENFNDLVTVKSKNRYFVITKHENEYYRIKDFYL